MWDFCIKIYDKLKLGQTIMILENRDELLDCDACILRANCYLRGMLRGAVYAFYDYLDQYILKDLNGQRTKVFIDLLIKK